VPDNPDEPDEPDRPPKPDEPGTPGEPRGSREPAEPWWPPGGYAGIGDEATPDLAGQLAAITTLGWRSIELRTVGGVALGDLDRAGTRALVTAVTARGIGVVCLDSRIGNWSRPITHPFAEDLDELRALAPLCAELGTRYVRIMSYPNDGLPETRWRQEVFERIGRLAREAERLGVTLLHENCAGWAASDAERTLDLLAVAGCPALRVLFDIGNGVAHGYPAADLLADLVPFVAHVHVKDAVGAKEKTGYVLPGEGDAGVTECLRILHDGGYAGALSIEPHLGLQPHLGAGAGDPAAFVDAGRRLVRLVREEVLAEVRR
jgi:sugar phosphate isomerase/epimerase